MDPLRFQYYAFISYSHGDSSWAAWLHGALEKFRLPSTLRKELSGQLPPSVKPGAGGLPG